MQLQCVHTMSVSWSWKPSIPSHVPQKLLQFGSILMWYLDKTKQKKTFQPSRLPSINLCILNLQTNSCDQSHFFRILQHVFQMSKYCSVNWRYSGGNLFASWERQMQSDMVNMFLNSLCGWDFLCLHLCTRTRGSTLLEMFNKSRNLNCRNVYWNKFKSFS